MDLKLATKTLSPARLHRYLKETDNNIDQALGLYDWNISISGDFMKQLAYVEVALRNSINIQLVEFYRTETWYLDNADLTKERQQDVEEVVVKLRRKAEIPGQVVANLMFGFWRFLLSSQYEKILWVPALHKGFQPGTNRKQLAKEISKINEFRNRIAHHEPIYKLDLAGIAESNFQILASINPMTEEWVRSKHPLTNQIASNPLNP